MKFTCKKNLQRDWTYPLLFLLGFLVVLGLHLFKAPLEIQGNDEVFYLTIPKRILDGDALLVHEWHGSQMSALLLLPFVWLHTLLCGFDKIVLHFRYVYIVVHALCAVVVYVRLRSYRLFGVLASLFFFLYTPYSIMALSYDSMGIMLMTLVVVLLATAKSKKVYCISGLLFAGAVLCCPYLILAYSVVTLVVWFYSWKAKNKDSFQMWGLFTLGSFLLAIPVLSFIFSKASLSEILDALPYIFVDPAHPRRSLLQLFFRYARAFFCPYTKKLEFTSIIVVFLCAITTLYAICDRNRKRHRWFFLLFSIISSLILLIEGAPFLLEKSYNYIMFPLLYTGLMSYIVTEKPNHRVFFSLFCGGLLYTLCIHLASNQGYYIIHAASTVINTGSILLLGDALTELSAEQQRTPPPIGIFAF